MTEKHIIDLDALDKEILEYQQRLLDAFNKGLICGDTVGSRFDRIRRYRNNIENELSYLMSELNESVEREQ